MKLLDVIQHHGIKGQKWGVRRYQNADGTWTEAGKKRYNYAQTQASDNYRKAAAAYKSAGDSRNSDKARAKMYENAESYKRTGDAYVKEFKELNGDEKVSLLMSKANSAKAKVAQDFVKTNPIAHYVFSADEFRVKSTSKNNREVKKEENKKVEENKNKTAKEIASKYNVSVERARRIVDNYDDLDMLEIYSFKDLEDALG